MLLMLLMALMLLLLASATDATDEHEHAVLLNRLIQSRRLTGRRSSMR